MAAVAIADEKAKESPRMAAEAYGKRGAALFMVHVETDLLKTFSECVLVRTSLFSSLPKQTLRQ